MRFTVSLTATFLAFELTSCIAAQSAYGHEASHPSCQSEQVLEISNWNEYLSVNIQIKDFEEPLTALFDTGSSDAVVSSQQFHFLLDEHKTERRLDTLTGHLTGRTTKPVQISAGECLLGETSLTLLESETNILRKLEEDAKSAVLIIGPQSFPEYNFEIDFLKQTLRMNRVSDGVPRLRNVRSYFAEIELEGQIFECLLDTDFVNVSGIFVRSNSKLAHHLISSGKKRRDGNVRVSNQAIPVWQMLVRDIKVGGLEGSALIQIEKDARNIDTDKLLLPACIVGTDALLNTRVHFNANNSTVRLNGSLNSGKYNRTGISSITKVSHDLLRINKVEKNTPADLLDLQAGDLIFRINDRNINEIMNARYIQDLFSQPSGQEISLGLIRDNNQEFVHLTLEELL